MQGQNQLALSTTFLFATAITMIMHSITRDFRFIDLALVCLGFAIVYALYAIYEKL